MAATGLKVSRSQPPHVEELLLDAHGQVADPSLHPQQRVRPATLPSARSMIAVAGSELVFPVQRLAADGWRRGSR
jgi:hypothetical protein